MSRDRLKDKYWEGKSSLEEEKKLKATETNTYFRGLEAAKDERLDWDFDDFIRQVEISEKSSKAIRFQPFWKYSGVAAALVIVGFLFLKNRENISKPIVIEAVEIQEAELQKAPVKIPLATTTNQSTVSVQKSKKMVLVKPPAKTAEESYITVNGIPLYDEQEAEQIFTASVQLIASNMKEGKEALEKIKLLNIKL